VNCSCCNLGNEHSTWIPCYSGLQSRRAMEVDDHPAAAAGAVEDASAEEARLLAELERLESERMRSAQRLTKFRAIRVRREREAEERPLPRPGTAAASTVAAAPRPAARASSGASPTEPEPAR